MQIRIITAGKIGYIVLEGAYEDIGRFQTGLIAAFTTLKECTKFVHDYIEAEEKKVTKCPA